MDTALLERRAINLQVLAGLSLFVIADVTAPRSTPLELQAIVPNYMVPFVPIIQKGKEPISMFVDLQHKYPWMMEVLRYKTQKQLIEYLRNEIIIPALKARKKLLKLKNQALQIRDIDKH